MYVPTNVRHFRKTFYLCDGCQELIQKAMSLIEVTIVSVKENSSRIHFWEISKDKSVSLKKKNYLYEKRKCVKGS